MGWYVPCCVYKRGNPVSEQAAKNEQGDDYGIDRTHSDLGPGFAISLLCELCCASFVAAGLPGRAGMGNATETDAATATEATATSTAAATGTAEDAGLAEITVTAERYTSTIQNTPISISALSGDQLTAAGLTRSRISRRKYPAFPCAMRAPA